MSIKAATPSKSPIVPAKLYDKMRLFVDDMSAIGQSLDKAQDNYRRAMKKLSSGRGNVLAQAEAFRGLG